MKFLRMGNQMNQQTWRVNTPKKRGNQLVMSSPLWYNGDINEWFNEDWTNHLYLYLYLFLSLSLYIYIIIYKCTLEISLEHNLAVPFFLDSMGISWDSRLCFFVYKTNWKDPPCYWWVNQLFQWAIFYVANCECHYQRVIGKPSPNYGSWYL